MARPQKSRRIESLPAPVFYIPAGWTKDQPPPVEVAIEDFEIMRLVDGQGYAIAEAAAKLGVSRSTAGRMLERARRVIALGIEKRAPICIDASPDLVLEPCGGEKTAFGETFGAAPGDRLAVACAEELLEAPVERIFGRASSFVVVAPDGSIVERVANPGFGAKRGAAKLAVGLLKSRGVSRVVAGRFGAEALEILAEGGIQGVVAAGFTLGQAIRYFNTARHEAKRS